MKADSEISRIFSAQFSGAVSAASAVLAAAGSAVVMVCHDMEVVSDFANRLVVMANGEILGRGTCADVFANDGLMQSAFVEPPQAIALAKRLAAEVSPAFAGLSEVSDIVAVSKELACRA